MGVGLAEHHRAGVLELLDDRGVVAGNVVVEEQRAGGGADAFGLEEILVRDRDAPQSAPSDRVKRLGFAPRQIRGHGDVGVERLVRRADARQVGVGELQRRDRS